MILKNRNKCGKDSIFSSLKNSIRRFLGSFKAKSAIRENKKPKFDIYIVHQMHFFLFNLKAEAPATVYAALHSGNFPPPALFLPLHFLTRRAPFLSSAPAVYIFPPAIISLMAATKKRPFPTQFLPFPEPIGTFTTLFILKKEFFFVFILMMAYLCAS